MLQTRHLSNLSAAFLAALLCFMPLYAENYENLTAARTLGSTRLCLGVAAAAALGCLAGAKPRPARWQDIGKNLPLAAAIVVAALVMAPNLPLALGAVLCCGCLWLWLDGLDIPRLLPFTALTAALVLGLYLANLFYIDPMGLFANQPPQSWGECYATMGSPAQNAGLLALLMPPVLWQFVFARSQKEALQWGIPSLFLLATPAVVSSPGLSIALLIVAALLLWEKRFTTTQLRRLLLMLSAVCLWAAVLSVAAGRWQNRGLPVLLSFGKAVAFGALLLICWGALFWAAAHGGVELSLVRWARPAGVLPISGAFWLLWQVEIPSAKPFLPVVLFVVLALVQPRIKKGWGRLCVAPVFTGLFGFLVWAVVHPNEAVVLCPQWFGVWGMLLALTAPVRFMPAGGGKPLSAASRWLLVLAGGVVLTVVCML